jgi:hypothetical protein
MSSLAPDARALFIAAKSANENTGMVYIGIPKQICRAAITK